MTKNIFYNREKQLTVQWDKEKKNLIFISLSAKDKELAIADAQQRHAHTVKLLTEAVDSIKSVYLLQDVELLSEALVHAERDKFLAKAVLTLAEDETNYHEKLEAKARVMMDARRAELLEVNKEQLADKLVVLEMERQLNNSWFYAVLEATLVRTLHDEERQRLFFSVDDLKASIAPDVLDKLFEALIRFLEECGNAQVFLRPHISRG